MPTKQQEKPHREPEIPDRDRRNASIIEQVLRTLGQPGGLHQVQVRPLWEHHYRVNVFVGGDATSALVAHSFFLVTDGEGNVTTSSPAITKTY